MTGADIIKVKDEIHSRWFELQRTKRADDRYAFLHKRFYDEIVELGHRAVDMLKEINPRSIYIRRIERPLYEVERQSWLADDTTIILGSPYYVMKPDRGKSVIVRDINVLANAVHRGGTEEIRYTDNYCGCDIPEHISLRDINSGVLKYCQGALELGGRKGKIMGQGDVVEHKPGSAAKHANVIQFVPTEIGHDIEMEYNESGDLNWRSRRNGVLDYVRQMGGECKSHDGQAKCTIPNVTDDAILELALFVSQLKDIDLLEEGCIGVAFDLVHQQIEELKQQEPEEIWNSLWTRARDFKPVMDCLEPVYEGETESQKEARERQLYKRLERQIEEADANIDWNISRSKDAPCTWKPFDYLYSILYSPDLITEDCKRIKKDTTEPYGWCETLATEGRENIKEAAKDLTDRCNAEPIILGMEARGQSMIIGEIEQVCKVAENQGCLDILHQVSVRELAGIHPMTLLLKPKE